MRSSVSKKWNEQNENWEMWKIIDMVCWLSPELRLCLDLLANNWTIDAILDEYPQLEREDIIAASKYAAEMVKEEKVYPLL
jgi:hypothetical protein